MKIIIHPLTYFIILSFLLCGYFNYFLIISIIIIVHDLGHLIFMKLFKIKIYNITIMPFGSIINTNIKYNISSNKLLLISLGGILIQLILYIIFYLLFKISFISIYSYNIFLNYNNLIILFNIMPIIPLDGSKILLSLIERLLPYKTSLIIINILSIVSIILFIFFNKVTFNIILLGLFLLNKTYIEILNHNFIYHKFLLERYLNNYHYSKIKIINNLKKVYKNRYNFIDGVREEEIYVKLFDKGDFF